MYWLANAPAQNTIFSPLATTSSGFAQISGIFLFKKKSNRILKNVRNAGSIFLGEYSPEAVGDYLAGPNHVLPTSGSARFSSGLSVYDFLKRYSVIKMTKSGIERLGTSVINLAEYENLEGHANSIKIRLKKRKNNWLNKKH